MPQKRESPAGHRANNLDGVTIAHRGRGPVIAAYHDTVAGYGKTPRLGDIEIGSFLAPQIGEIGRLAVALFSVSSLQ